MKKVYIKVFGWQMDAVLYDCYSVFEWHLLSCKIHNEKEL